MDAVATQVNPNAGLDTYARLLGLQQNQVALQNARQQYETNQYLQQTAAAQAAQQQQAVLEMRAGAQLMADPLRNGIVDKDGNPTADAYQRIKRVMPITGDAQYQKMLEAARGKVEYANAYTDLNEKQRSAVNSALEGVASNPDAKAGDVLSRLETLRQDYAGTGAEASIGRIIANTSKGIGAIRAEVGDGPNGAIHPKLQQYLLGLSRGSTGNQSLVGAGGINAPTNATVDSGGQIQPGVVAPAAAGGGFTPSGAPIQKTLAPNQTPGYAGQVAAATTSATGNVTSDIARKNEISSVVAPSSQAISTISEIRNLADQIRQGKYSQVIIDQQLKLGDKSPAITAQKLLKKDLAMLQTTAGSAATTDSQRATLHDSLPDPDNPDVNTIYSAMDRVEGAMRLNLARSRSARDFLAKHPDASGLQTADDMYARDADPLMYTYNNLKSSQEKIEFIRRHFKSQAEAQDFINRKNAKDHHGGLSE